MEFFSWAGLGTLAGAVGAVVVVANTFRKLLNIDSLWVPLAVSALVVFAVAATQDQLNSLADYVIGFFNSCLLFCTALGLNDTVVAGGIKPATDTELPSRRVRLRQTWLARGDS